MARMVWVDNGEIERIKQEVSIQQLVEYYGVSLKKKGNDLVGLCPMHDDKEPSLVVTPGKNLWHCLGACQEGGSVIDWIMKIEGISFRHAVEILKERHLPGGIGVPGGNGNGRGKEPVKIAVPPKPVKHSRARKLDCPFKSSIEKQELLNQVVDFYHETLKDSPEGLQYLQNRGLKNPEIIDCFKLGLSNRTLGYRLPEKRWKAGAEIREKLEQLGILRESGSELFRGSLIIPIFDEKGNVVEIYGRKLNNHLREGTAYHLYLPGPHRGIWNFSCLAASKEIILCEALIDALTFWCYGFRNVTASYGINGFTKEHLEAFKRFGTQRVLIAYDRDEAGNKAAESLAEKLMTEVKGIECFRINFPLEMDANQYVQYVQDRREDQESQESHENLDVEESLKQLIQHAHWMGKSKNVKTFENNQKLLPGVEGVPWHGGPIGDGFVAEDALENSKHTCNLHLALLAEKTPPRSEVQITKNTAKEENKNIPVPVSVYPPAPRCDILAEIKAEEVIIPLDDRRWRIRGLGKNMSYELLKANVLVSMADKFHVDTLDLYSARQRAAFIKQAAVELEEEEEVIKKDLGKVLLKLEELQDEQIKQSLAPKKKEIVMNEKEKQEALALLKAPDLLERIVRDFEKCGVVGEKTNKLVGYLASVSRKLESPLAILIQSSSAAGKTWLMESVLAFVPEEERIKYSAMTGQSLFYMGESNLKHKILAIVEEEGAERTRYALKLLQSEGELSIASTGKDPVTGLLGTKEYRVEGPVMIFSTTTNIDIDEELQNRCIILTVDESREQTRAIHQMQRERRTFEGLRLKKEKDSILKLHRNAQRLLLPLSIINPYARRLTFLDDKTRTRRDHEKYLSLIDSIAFLNQYQRQIKRTNYGNNGKPDEHIIVTLEDIELANRLANEVLGRSLDELPPQTRNLLMIIDEMVEKECKKLEIERSEYRFSRRQVREYCGWGNTWVKMQFKRLEELEYLIVHRGKRGLTFEYELLYDGKGKDGSLFLMGLIDVEKLRSYQHQKPDHKDKNKDEIYEYDENKSGAKGQIYEYDGNKSGFLSPKSPPSHPQVTPRSVGGQGVLKPLVNKVLPFFFEESEKKGTSGLAKKEENQSYVIASPSPSPSPKPAPVQCPGETGETGETADQFSSLAAKEKK